MKKLSLLLLAGLCSAAFSVTAQQPAPKIQTVTMKPTSPTSGPQMYGAYCASCHGADARGKGPAAPSLKLPPTDLTMLSQRNGGTFPTYYVAEVLRSGGDSAAHHSTEMPGWGNLMQTPGVGGVSNETMVRLRISNLTAYLKTLQK
jgi:mono/diheme cytochrome c family protein